MRVAVRHTDETHPNHGWFAFEQGRILGFTHPVTGETMAPEQVADALLKRARERFPREGGYEHRIETLHAAGVDENGHEIGEWHQAGTSELPLTGHGHTAAQALEVEQTQEEST